MMYLILTCLLLAAPSDRPNLHGVVTSKAGGPIAGAHVFIDTAAVRHGTGATCPSCYPDCGKRTATTADGCFTMPSLDPSLLFGVLVIADGHRPQLVRRVDPLGKPIEVKLEPSDLSMVPPERIVRGMVVDPDGKPVVGATLEAHSYRTEVRSGAGPGIFDPLAISDLNGNFTLVATSPIRDVTLEVAARNLAPRLFPAQKPAPTTNRLELGVGGEVTGRLVHAGQPVGGVVVGLVQCDRGSQSLFVPMTIATDAKGQFLFRNVPPDRDCFVAGIMESLKDLGGAPSLRIKVGGEGTRIDVGDLAIVPGHLVAGQVILNDGKPVPVGTRLQISREGAWDHCTTTLDADGQFRFANIPGERVSVSVPVPGYHLSRRNKSIDPYGSDRLVGFIEGDLTGLKILLEAEK